MIDLAAELDAHAKQGATGAPERLTTTATQRRIRERIERGRRRMNGVIAASIVLVAVLAGTVSAPPAPTDMAQPSPSATARANAQRDRLPIVYSPDYLVSMQGKYEAQGTLSCAQIPTVPISTDGSPFPGFMAGLPRWIEINRIYGLPNELPAAYPIPLYLGDGSGRYNQSLLSLPKLYPAEARVVVALIAADGSWWGFEAEYGVREAMPFDRPGMYVTLTPDPACNGGTRSANGETIPPGVYVARQMTSPLTGLGETTVRDLGTVEVVRGLPSIPQLNVTK